MEEGDTLRPGTRCTLSSSSSVVGGLPRIWFRVATTVERRSGPMVASGMPQRRRLFLLLLFSPLSSRSWTLIRWWQKAWCSSSMVVTRASVYRCFQVHHPFLQRVYLLAQVLELSCESVDNLGFHSLQVLFSGQVSNHILEGSL